MSVRQRPLASAHVLLVGETDWVGTLAETLETRTDASVRSVATARAALDALDDGPVDCVVAEYDLAGATGLELLRSVRDGTRAPPVVLCTAAADETVASDAVGAGASDYVALDDPSDPPLDDLEARIGRAVRAAERATTRRERARQFDATFHDGRTATWVLDPAGSLLRVNETAREMVGVDAAGLTGRPFWTLPWWSGSDRTGADVRSIVGDALDGAFGEGVVTRSTAEGRQVVELAARPVEDCGDVVSVVVEGVDVTERVDLERDLRRSEELHRVTLNNMTDTVLITDERGEYTYVCPNAHFIFGYTADEIRELGPITDLLGEDMFDREALAAEGVLKNIECTATDKAGVEHTLLVNVREVSIQDGTLLYSCRDITKRKQREEALATLQETARDFLYAETHREIAQQVVEDAPAVLDVDACAVYLFDATDNDFRPAAWSDGMERLSGPLPTVHADADGPVGRSFLEDESLVFDDVHDAGRLDDPATELRSAAYIPLGEHGVFVAGSADVGRFDGVTSELADLLAATAEAALDRVRRESRLRAQDRELQRRNAELTALDRVNEIIREIDGALVQAETRAEIEHAVCERLTDDDRFAFAWIGVVDPISETVEPRSWAGDERGYLDSLPFRIGAEGEEPAGRTAATREVTAVSHVADSLREESWRTEALTRDYLSVLSVPLAYDELAYGVLTVYATRQGAFDETARAVLAELGETIASATSALERKTALLTTSMTRVEFDVDDPAFVLTRVARAADCTLSYQGGVQQTDEGNYVYVSVANATGDAVVRAAERLVAVEEAQRISGDDTEGVFRLRLSRPFLALELADHGAILRSASVDPDGARLVVDVPDGVDVRSVTRIVTESVAAVDLRSKQTVDRSSTHDPYSRFLDQLTDRQFEVLQTAYYSGFFESPRESTGEEIAATLGISPTAFYEHARTVQRTLFSTIFDDVGVSAQSTAR
jgi:PAS domain S-box-containing protein